MDVLSWFGAFAVVASLAISDPLRFRIVNLGAAVVMLLANARLGLLALVTVNAVIIAMNTWHIRRLVVGGGATRSPVSPGRRRRRPRHPTGRPMSAVDVVRIQHQLR